MRQVTQHFCRGGCCAVTSTVAGLESTLLATMVRKKVDARVRTLIENGVKSNHRSTFVLVGDHGKDQARCSLYATRASAHLPLLLLLRLLLVLVLLQVFDAQ